MNPRRRGLWVEVALALALLTLATILLNAGVFWLLLKKTEEQRLATSMGYDDFNVAELMPLIKFIFAIRATKVKRQGPKVDARAKSSLELNNLSAVAFKLENSECLYKLCVGPFALELGAIGELNVAGSIANAVALETVVRQAEEGLGVNIWTRVGSMWGLALT